MVKKYSDGKYHASDAEAVYSQLQTMREKSDYNCTYNATEEDIVPKIERTGQFINRVLGLITQRQTN